MASSSALGDTFNAFLFATVYEARDEMPLTVVSALARLDLDPWSEAAELARMPADGAARRLSTLLAGVISDPSAQRDRASIAVRLVTLLPTPARSDGLPPGRAVVVVTAPTARALRILCMIFMASLATSVLIAQLTPRVGASAAMSAPQPSIAAHR